MRRTLALSVAILSCAVAAAQFPDPPRTVTLPKLSADAPTLHPEKQIHQPSPVPDRVILTWAGDPATTQAVTWRTNTSVQKAIAQIAPSEGGPAFSPIGSRTKSDKVIEVPAVTNPLKSDLNDAHYHSANFIGLSPHTKYVYRVGDGVNWSEWFQFETASDKPAPLRFIYFGDAQNDLKQHWSRVVRGAYSDMPKAQFIVHAGDLVNVGSRDADWGEWHAAAGWINGMVPTVPTPGNHEYAGQPGLTTHWRPQFTLPENGPDGLHETAYYFDIQGVRIVSLNTIERPAEQVPWLDAVLKNNPCKWTVLTFHYPIYSTAKGRDNKTVRELWRPIIDQYGVDLVLTGHDHTYGRSGLMREDNLVEGTRVAEKGTVYVVSVSGPKMYSLEEEPWMKSSAKDTQLYQLITIDDDKLHYEARTAKGDLYDEFELRKKKHAGNQIVERDQLDAERKTEAQPTRTQLIVAVAAMLSVAAFVLALKVGRWLARRKGGKPSATAQSPLPH